MNLEFPYQIVTFLDREPQNGEPVYYGENGWFAQLALKRRFKLNGIDVSQLVQLLRPFFDHENKIKIITGSLTKPKHMPISVIDIKNESELKSLHKQLLEHLNGCIISRYPDREGENYYAHITAEHDNTFVIPVDQYSNKEFTIDNVWLLMDIDDENSKAYIKIR